MRSEIEIQGKKINLENLSDEQLINLFARLTKKELELDEKILMLERAIENMEKNV